MPINEQPTFEGRGDSGLHLNYKVKPSAIELIELGMRQRLQRFAETLEAQTVAHQTQYNELFGRLMALQQEQDELTMAWGLNKVQFAKRLIALEESVAANNVAVLAALESINATLKAEQAYTRLWPWQKFMRWFRGRSR